MALKAPSPEDRRRAYLIATGTPPDPPLQDRVAATLTAAGHPPELAPALCAIAARTLLPDSALLNWLAWHRGDCTAAEFQRFADIYTASAHQLATYRSRPGGAA